MYGIFTYIYHTNQPIVGKYTSPMDPMGKDAGLKGRLSQAWRLCCCFFGFFRRQRNRPTKKHDVLTWHVFD